MPETTDTLALRPLAVEVVRVQPDASAKKRRVTSRICETCQKVFAGRTDSIGRYCSRSCSAKSPQRREIAKARWDRIYEWRQKNLVPLTIKKVTAIIPLPCGKSCLVDTKDFEGLKQHSWSAYFGGDRYVGCPRVGLIHRIILRAGKGEYVDHRDHNPLNNRKSNLRLCTQAQNSANGSAHRDGSSKFKGVSFYRRDSVWVAMAKNKYLGRFRNEEEAAMAYDDHARKVFGEFSSLNFPGDSK